MLEQQIFKGLYALLGIIFTGLAGVASKEIIRWLRTHQKMKWAAAAVKFVEETYKDLDGNEKFAKACTWLANQLSNVGIKKISSSEIEGLIQASVKDMRQVFNKEYEDPANQNAKPDSPNEVIKQVSEMTSNDLKKLITDIVNPPQKATPEAPQQTTQAQ